ncbi:MAG TPA: DNA polymerase I [Firmicutes bacterium]|nr:DNA polymerase I [Bacillota bacterium]
MQTGTGNSKGKVVLVDGNSLIHRAFYALPTLTTSQGEHTNAVLGFTTMLLRLLEDEEPDYMAVAFDLAGPTFRHQEFQDYKATRPKMAEELVPQVGLIKQVVEAFGIPILETPGYEADDIIGTLACYHRQLGRKVMIVTGDQDCLQLVDENTTVLLTRRGITNLEAYDVQQVKAKHGVPPGLMADLKGLMGDASDNIPGVPGIGPKTAAKLLQDFGSLEDVLKNTDKLRGKQRESLEKYADQARLSRRLATINCQVPIDCDLLPYSKRMWQKSKLYELFSRLEFRSIISRLGLSAGGVVETASGEKTEFSLFSSPEELRSFINDLKGRAGSAGGVVFLDPYIDGDDSIDAVLVGMGLSDGTRSGYLPVAPGEGAVEALKELFGSVDLIKVCFDTKALYHALANMGLRPEGTFFDISLAAYLLNPGQNIEGLEDVLLQVLDVYQPGVEELTGKGAKAISLGEVDCQKLAEFSRHRLAHLPALYAKLEEELRENDMEQLYKEIELPLAKVLALMERRGVAVDVRELRTISEEFGERIDRLAELIYSLAGMEFNINSPKQLAEVLFHRLGLPVLKETKTGPSTSAEVLEQLAEEHEIARLVMDYRQLVKLKSTYLDTLEHLVHPVTGRIHTSFHQRVTATGRLSSVNPNLQNIPVRTAEGRRIRRAFTAGHPDYVILAADYSQIELRVLAHMSKDPAWLEAFRSGADIHSRTAAEVFGLDMDDVTPALRSAAKAINFGIVYGISSFGLSKGTGLPVQQAQAYIDRYFQKYTGVKEYLDRVVEEARERGYVTTLFNRRRYLPDIRSKRWALRSFAERAAMNAPIQGTAADIIKMAMIAVEEKIAASGLRAKMLLQVHDELVFEVHIEDLLAAARLIKETMEGIVTLDVPLVVDVASGANWGDVMPVFEDT